MEDFEQLDHYAILGVQRSATADEIKQAYRQQIRRYHPDRYAGASEAERAYASRRALRINEAYRVLSDFSERSAYNRGLGGPQAAPPRPTPPPQAPRDHQAELYAQAQEHLAAGRHMQAAAVLRELLRINPFYRDSSELLASAEAAARPATASAPAAPGLNRRHVIIGGIGGLGLLGAAGAAWLLRQIRPGQAAPSAAGVATSPSAVAAGAVPGAPTAAPTAPPSPTLAPPTAATPSPTLAQATPTAEPLAESGALLLSDSLSSGPGWPSASGASWQVGYVDGAYQILAGAGAGNIWAYNSAPAADNLLIGVTVSCDGGEGGLLLRFSEGSSYLAFFVNPQAGSFRLERRQGGAAQALAEGQSPAVAAGENRLAALLRGERLELRVNGQPVFDQILASPPPSVRYGLVAVAAPGGAGVTARFRDLALRALEG